MDNTTRQGDAAFERDKGTLLLSCLVDRSNVTLSL